MNLSRALVLESTSMSGGSLRSFEDETREQHGHARKDPPSVISKQ